MVPEKEPEDEGEPVPPNLRIVEGNNSSSGIDAPQISLEPIVAILSFMNKAERLRGEFKSAYLESMAAGIREMAGSLPVKRRLWLGARYVEFKKRFFRRGQHWKMACQVFDSIQYPEWFSHVKEHKGEAEDVSNYLERTRIAADHFAAYLKNVEQQSQPDYELGSHEEEIKGHVSRIFEAVRGYEGAACGLAKKLPDCEEDMPGEESMDCLEACVNDVNMCLAEVGAAGCTAGLFTHAPLLQEAVKGVKRYMSSMKTYLTDTADFKGMIWRSEEFGEFLERELGFDVRFVEYGHIITIDHDSFTSSSTKLPVGNRAVYARKYLDKK